MKRPASFARKVVDPANSVAWFAMDGLWLAGLAWPAYAATGLTLATGALLLMLDRKWGRRLLDNLALNAWMWMNSLWVLADLGEMPALRRAALGVAGLGAVLLALAVRPDGDVPGTFRRFRKLRLPDR